MQQQAAHSSNTPLVTKDHEYLAVWESVPQLEPSCEVVLLGSG